MTSLVSVKQLNEPMVEWLLRQAQYYIEHEPKIKINGHAVNLFLSELAYLSFQLAARRMGLTLLNEWSSQCEERILMGPCRPLMPWV